MRTEERLERRQTKLRMFVADPRCSRCRAEMMLNPDHPRQACLMDDRLVCKRCQIEIRNTRLTSPRLASVR